MTDRHLAQFNYAKARFPVEDPRMAEFMRGVDMVNRIADQSPGFVWKLITEPGGTMPEPLYGDPLNLVNMSVWESVADLDFFVRATLHKRFLQGRAAWFEELDQATQVMWWIAPGHVPSVAEGIERLEQLRREGAGPEVFDWAQARAAGLVPPDPAGKTIDAGAPRAVQVEDA